LGFLIAGLLLAASAFAVPLIPTKERTTWSYNMIHEAGEGIKFSGTDPDAGGRLHASVLYRIAGTRNVDGKQSPDEPGRHARLRSENSLPKISCPTLVNRYRHGG
jgi:hypothetical protein